MNLPHGSDQAHQILLQHNHTAPKKPFHDRIKYYPRGLTPEEFVSTSDVK